MVGTRGWRLVPTGCPPPRFLTYISKHCRFLLKKSTQAYKKLKFCMKIGKPCYLCYDKQNRLVTRGWRLVTIFFFFLSFSLSFFLFLFLLFPFISFIFFISFSLFYVFYLFYFFYLFFLYMKFLKSCIYTCLYDM